MCVCVGGGGGGDTAIYEIKALITLAVDRP